MKPVVARVLAAVTVGAAVAVVAGPAPAAVAGGLLLGMVLPGLAVTAVLFRGRALTAVERTVLAPALSLVVLIAAGLIIYVTGYALDRAAWTAATAGVTLLALVAPAIPLPRRTAAQVAASQATERQIVDLAAAAKRAVLASTGPVGEQRVRMTPGTDTVQISPPDGAPPPAAAPPPAGARPEKPPPLPLIARQLIPIVLALVVLGAAGWLSYVNSRNSYDTTVTALSAAPPSEVDAAGRRLVTVTASGLVAADGPYRLSVVGPDSTQTRQVPVPGSGTWTARLSVSGARITVSLFRAGDTAAYRTLYIAAVD